MKKTVPLVLVAIMLLALLAGCTGDNGNNGTTSTSPSGSASTEPSAQAPEANSLPLTDTGETLSMLLGTHPIMLQYISGPEEQLFYMEMQERTGVQMEYIAVSGADSAAQIAIYINAGELPDMLCNMRQQFDPFGGVDYAVDEGLIIDMKSYIEQYAPNYTAVMDMFPNLQSDFVTDSGYIVQFCQVAETDCPPSQGMAIRQDWLDNLSLDVPVTYAEYESVLRAFQAEYNPKATLHVGTSGMGNHLSAGYGIGTEVGTDDAVVMYVTDGDVKYAPTEPKFKEFLMTMSEWYADGLIYQDFASATTRGHDPDESLLLTDDMGIFLCNTVTNMSNWAEAAENPDFRVVAINAPRLDENEQLHFRWYDPPIHALRGYMISANCENIELAVKWCDYIYSDEGTVLANYGVEDYTFTYVDGVPTFTDLIVNNPDGMALNFALNIYCVQSGSMLIDWNRTVLGYTGDEAAAAGIWSLDDYEYLYPDAVTMTVDESNEFSNIMSDLGTYVTENYMQFILGLKPFDEYDAFVQQIYTMSLERALELKQDAYDRYLTRAA